MHSHLNGFQLWHLPLVLQYNIDTLEQKKSFFELHHINTENFDLENLVRNYLKHNSEVLGESESQYRCYQKESSSGHQTPQDLHIKNAQRAIKQDLRTAEETANLRFSFKHLFQQSVLIRI